MIESLQNNIQNDIAKILINIILFIYSFVWLSIVGDKVDPRLGQKIHINIILLKVQ